MYKIDWIKSPLKNEIELYSSCNTLGDLLSPLLFIGGVHGDEPEGVYLAESFIEWLKQQKLQSLKSFVVIPCLNVDGYKYNQRTNSNGVDLNRNFPTPMWQPDSKAPRYYPGISPNSEIETQALTQLIEQIKPQLIFHFHSWKPCVVVTGPKDLNEARYLCQSSGFEAVNDIGYPTPGSLGDFGWNVLKIPVICTEDNEHRNPLKAWLHFGEGLKKIILK